MKQAFLENKHSMKMMWGCATIVLLAVVLALAINPYVLLFVIPCAIMMGAMVWMMVRGMGGGTSGANRR